MYSEFGMKKPDPRYEFRMVNGEQKFMQIEPDSNLRMISLIMSGISIGLLVANLIIGLVGGYRLRKICIEEKEGKN